ncbi:enoyl-CoA hydratase/isomerase family protein [Leifsonia sp. fls2-241-R2A-40a]|uniref:enoyl-CoA hydratase/isomerase family protein n=1 Tax=Leifsonia sp. fls2-241-R2A-40a TaxID=3040290 RepID=UPI00254EAC75|nr:enoyl-CoA hydratase/isomerase family protein [Leifsonia sp. fls2-241-R2A-40a]
MTDDRSLRIEEHPDRVVVTLDRPERRNAIDQAMVNELHGVCAALESEPRILLLTGAHGVFASGADIAELRERTAADAHRGINDTIFDRIAALPMPVIAALDGYALGGGAELAYAADLRVGTPRLRIGNPETGLGIIAAAGALWRLPQLVGLPLATELVLTGRILNGQEALAAGLVSSLHEPEDLLGAAHALADRIAANDPLATRLTKRVLRAPIAEHPAAEREAQAELFESPEKKRRMTEFLERRSR